MESCGNTLKRRFTTKCCCCFDLRLGLLTFSIKFIIALILSTFGFPILKIWDPSMEIRNRTFHFYPYDWTETAIISSYTLFSFFFSVLLERLVFIRDLLSLLKFSFGMLLLDC